MGSRGLGTPSPHRYFLGSRPRAPLASPHLGRGLTVRHWLVVLVCLSPASAPLAEEAPAVEAAASKPLGVELSLRLGPAAPINFVLLDQPLFPLELALGYRFGGLVYAGIAGVYAFGPTENGDEPLQHPVPRRGGPPPAPLCPGGPVGWLRAWRGMVQRRQRKLHPGESVFGRRLCAFSDFRVGPFFTFQVAFHGSDVHEWCVVGLQLTALP